MPADAVAAARSRLDAEIVVDECAAGLLISLERFRLAPRSVESEHQLAAGTLSERILSD